MAFTAEDGTGVEGANAYGSVSGYKAHHADRGVDVTGQTDSEIEQRLIKAADYMSTRWGSRFRGRPKNFDQGLHFPAVGICDRHGRTVSSDSVPPKVEQAAYEYAFRANAALYVEPTSDPTGGKVTGVRKKVGPLETETTFAEGAAVEIFKPIPAADRLLSDFVSAGAGAIRA